MAKSSSPVRTSVGSLHSLYLIVLARYAHSNFVCWLATLAALTLPLCVGSLHSIVSAHYTLLSSSLSSLYFFHPYSAGILHILTLYIICCEIVRATLRPEPPRRLN